jgi:pSer/pThr/pTyr-binding forkhead associated (FHA) protein
MVSHPVVRLASDARLEAGDLRVEPHLRDLTTGERVFEHTSILPQVSDPVAPVRATPNLVLDGQQYTVLRSPARVGRLPDNDIVLNDKRVSRHHAQVVNRGNRWVLRDTGSTNGTAVNGKIVEEAVLKPGDTISLGGLEVTWEE